jgi:hypothetical protein
VSSGFEDATITGKRLGLLECGGAGRGATDMLGAMLYFLDEHKWDGDFRFMLIIAANPPYGKYFHISTVSDGYPNQRYGKEKFKHDEVVEDVRLGNIEILIGKDSR